MLKRRTKKMTKSMVTKVTGRLILECSECKMHEVEVPADIGKVVCAYCVQKMIAPPAGYKKAKDETSKKPRGWQLKRYFEFEGNVYSRGKLITDPKVIAELKSPMPVVKKVAAKKTAKKKVAKRKPVRKIRATKKKETTA
jgi:hypothetical protein